MKTLEEIKQLAANLANPNACKTTNWIEGYTQCQEDIADMRFTEKQLLRAIDLATQVYEKKDGKIVYSGAMSAQDILTTLETEKYTNTEGLPYKEFPPKKQDNE